MKNPIDYKEIKKLLELMEERELSHFELEVEGFKISFSKNQKTPLTIDSLSWIPASAPEDRASNSTASQTTEQQAQQKDLHYILSPMVGTFYRSSNPASPPFVEVGEMVKKNQTLCIIEAMKLMNEIESDTDGVVEEIFIENGKPIEYGQRLFALKSI
jgi:acetyl-CoA carboxylase biotin carboxyl carrier protein